MPDRNKELVRRHLTSSF